MSTHPTPSSSRASPAFVAGFVTPASGVPSSACSTPMERRLTAQVTRQDSKLRQINDELEDRTRLLERARVSVETLQADLARARDGEDESRRLARERLEANALRISELERELATARGDDRARDDETHALRVRVATLEEQLDERADDVERLEGELALRASTAESHRADAVEAAKSIDDLHERLRAAESVAADAVTRAENVEGEGATLNATILDLRADAAAAKIREDRLRDDVTSLRDALEEAARRHEVSVAASEETMRRVRRGLEAHDASDVAGSVSGGLGERLARLHARVGELAERERRMMARQTAMAEEMEALRATAEEERERRFAAEASARAAAEALREKLWAKDEEAARLEAEKLALALRLRAATADPRRAEENDEEVRTEGGAEEEVRGGDGGEVREDYEGGDCERERG